MCNDMNKICTKTTVSLEQHIGEKLSQQVLYKLEGALESGGAPPPAPAPAPTAPPASKFCAWTNEPVVGVRPESLKPMAIARPAAAVETAPFDLRADLEEAYRQAYPLKAAACGMKTRARRLHERYAAGLGRGLVCLYFVNIALDGLQCYLNQSWTTTGRQGQQPFPLFASLVLVPSAILVGLNFKVHLFGCVLALNILQHDLRGVYHLALEMARGNLQPNPTMMKEVAMLGCVAVTLSACMSQNKRDRLAGLILEKKDERSATRRSVALLVGRVLMASMFIYVGYVQLERLGDPDAPNTAARPQIHTADGRGNPLVFLQFALGLPFLMGFRFRATTWALIACLVMEALVYWNFLANEWGPQGAAGSAMGRPLWWFTMRARRHFVANMGIAGGLLLLQSFGPGRFTMDEIIAKRD